MRLDPYNINGPRDSLKRYYRLIARADRRRLWRGRLLVAFWWPLARVSRYAAGKLDDALDLRDEAAYALAEHLQCLACAIRGKGSILVWRGAEAADGYDGWLAPEDRFEGPSL